MCQHKSFECFVSLVKNQCVEFHTLHRTENRMLLYFLNLSSDLNKIRNRVCSKQFICWLFAFMVLGLAKPTLCYFLCRRISLRVVRISLIWVQFNVGACNCAFKH